MENLFNMPQKKGRNVDAAEAARRAAQSARDKARNGNKPKAVRKQRKNKKTKGPKAPRLSRAAKIQEVTGVSWAPPTRVLTKRNQVLGRVESPVLKYLKTLMDPEFCNSRARIPDSFSRSTGMFTSHQQYSFPLVPDTNGNSYFSACIQPKIGGYGSLNQAQIQIANVSSANWFAGPPTTDWSNVDSYARNLEGSSPPLDPNYFIMTSPPAENSGFIVSPPGTGTSTNMFAGTFEQNDENSLGFVLSSPSPNTLNIPVGVWILVLTITATQGTANTGVAGVAFGDDGEGTNCTYVEMQEGSSDWDTPTSSYAVSYTGYVVAQQAASLQMVLFVNGVTATYAASGSLNLTNTEVQVLLIAAQIPGVQSALTLGPVERIRPVAQSAWVSYMGTDLYNGGEITMAYVDADYANTCFFGNAPLGSFQAQNVDKLAEVNEDMWTGPLKTGAYGFWSPQTIADTEFKTIPDHLNSDFNCLIVSGVSNPGQTGVVSKIRIRVFTVFEFTTAAQAWETCSEPGRQSYLDDTFQAIGRMRHCMENKTHLQKLREYLTMARNWLNAHPQVTQGILMAGKAIGSAALAAL